eukprot:gene6964-7705_t
MSAFNITATASAPGKAILFGEHAVVYGVTAIAVALSDLRLFVEVVSLLHPLPDINQTHHSTFQKVNNAGNGLLQALFEDIKGEDGQPTSAQISLAVLRDSLKLDSDPLVPNNPSNEVQSFLQATFAHYPSAACQGMMAISYMLASIILPSLSRSDPLLSNVGVEMRMWSVGLPIGAGLGSSAAFAVAAAGALIQLYSKLNTDHGLQGDNNETSLSQSTKDLINAWAYAGEVLIHGLPSGLDNTTSCYGGMVKFTRREGNQNEFESLDKLPELDILLTNTFVPRGTKVLVAGVRQLRDTFPTIVNPIFQSIQNITDTFLDKVNSVQGISDDEMASLVSMNHHLLFALGVGHQSLERVAQASVSQGFACKLTGAGGGGCAITLLNNTSDRDAKTAALRSELSEIGYEVLQTRIGGQGVRWH